MDDFLGKRFRIICPKIIYTILKNQALLPYCKKIKIVGFWDFDGKVQPIKDFIKDISIDFVHYEWPRSLLNFDHSLGKFHIFTFMEAVSLRLVMDMAAETPMSTLWLNKMVELLKYLKIELVDCDHMDAFVSVTQKDARFLSNLNPNRVNNVLNHGVTFEEFCLPDTLPEGNTIAYVGNFRHYPNEDAMLYFMKEIWPLIQRQAPGVKIYMVGANPTEKIKLYADNHNIFVTGSVKDIRPYIQKASVCIAPLVTGAGLRGKVIQYAALKRPFVATSIAVEDLVFEDGIDYFRADDPESFAQKVIHLLENPLIASEMAQSAYQKALFNYDNEHLVDFLQRIYSNLENENLELINL